MRAEDVKIGLQVKNIHDGRLATVTELADANNFYTVKYDLDGLMKVNYYDFEPYEELKEKVKYAINYDKIDNLILDIENNKFLSAKDVVKLMFPEQALPITQEFIESFGFKAKFIHKSGTTTYDKYVVINGKINKLVLQIDDNGYSLINDYLGGLCAFSDMKITTQSEFRFLLTKGRIDCSK